MMILIIASRRNTVINDKQTLKEWNDCMDFLVDAYIHKTGAVMVRQTFIVNGEFVKQVKTVSMVEDMQNQYNDSQLGRKENMKFARELLKEMNNG